MALFRAASYTATLGRTGLRPTIRPATVSLFLSSSSTTSPPPSSTDGKASGKGAKQGEDQQQAPALPLGTRVLEGLQRGSREFVRMARMMTFGTLRLARESVEAGKILMKPAEQRTRHDLLLLNSVFAQDAPPETTVRSPHSLSEDRPVPGVASPSQTAPFFLASSLPRASFSSLSTSSTITSSSSTTTTTTTTATAATGPRNPVLPSPPRSPHPAHTDHPAKRLRGRLRGPPRHTQEAMERASRAQRAIAQQVLADLSNIITGLTGTPANGDDGVETALETAWNSLLLLHATGDVRYDHLMSESARSLALAITRLALHQPWRRTQRIAALFGQPALAMPARKVSSHMRFLTDDDRTLHADHLGGISLEELTQLDEDKTAKAAAAHTLFTHFSDEEAAAALRERGFAPLCVRAMSGEERRRALARWVCFSVTVPENCHALRILARALDAH